MEHPSRGEYRRRVDQGEVVVYRVAESAAGYDGGLFAEESPSYARGDYARAGRGPATGHATRDEESRWHSGLPRKWKRVAPWRQDVQRRRIMLLDDLHRIGLKQEALRPELDYLIGDLLADANAASQRRGTVGNWWWGTEIERAWARLREVEERLVDFLPDDELLAHTLDTVEHARFHLNGGDDERVRHLQLLHREAVKTSPPTLPEGLRPAIISVLRASHARADQTNQEARFLRNRLLLASGVVVLVAALLVLAQWRLPSSWLVGRPTGWGASSTAYLLTVMLFGSVGALFTAIPAATRNPPTSARSTCRCSNSRSSWCSAHWSRWLASASSAPRGRTKPPPVPETRACWPLWSTRCRAR